MTEPNPEESAELETEDNASPPPPPTNSMCLLKQKEAQRLKEEASKRVLIKSKTNIWENACNEIQEERNELNAILMSLGLPSTDYSKDKHFALSSYPKKPDYLSCSPKEYIDFYILPSLLQAIQALILFVRKHRILQCRVSTFNSMDFLSEYLYNRNPRRPERNDNPMPLFRTPFAKAWLEKFPRPPPPKWICMPRDDAANIIQKVFRGYLVRKRENIQELRQFWKAYKKDQQDFQERQALLLLDEEDEGESWEMPEGEVLPPFRTHSQDCDLCAAFREFLSVKKEVPTQLEKESPDSGSLEQKRDKGLKPPPPTRVKESRTQDRCCFHPEGHLLFSMHKSKEKLRPHPSLSCISHICHVDLEVIVPSQHVLIHGFSNDSNNSQNDILSNKAICCKTCTTPNYQLETKEKDFIVTTEDCNNPDNTDNNP